MTSGFLWILLSVSLYGALHSILAGQPAKEWAARRFGEPGRRWYRLFFSVMGAVTFLPSLALVALLPDAGIYRIPAPFSLLTLGIQALAGLALLYGVRQTGAWAFLGLAPEPQPARLVTTGLYRRVRHPLYTAGLVFLWLTPVMSWNILALCLGVTAYLLVGIRFEERKLQRVFGEAYRAYAARTPMLIPRL